jgi:hypothetical protein
MELKTIAEATAYTTRAIRTAADEMTLAGFIQEIEGRPSAFYADPKAWAHLLHANRVHPSEAAAFPRWRYWSAIFLFLSSVIDWAEAAERGKWTDYVVSSRAYDLFESHRRPLKQAQVDLPASAKAQGADYLGDFEDLIQRVQVWSNASLYHMP